MFGVAIWRGLGSPSLRWAPALKCMNVRRMSDDQLVQETALSVQRFGIPLANAIASLRHGAAVAL